MFVLAPRCEEAQDEGDSVLDDNAGIRPRLVNQTRQTGKFLSKRRLCHPNKAGYLCSGNEKAHSF